MGSVSWTGKKPFDVGMVWVLNVPTVVTGKVTVLTSVSFIVDVEERIQLRTICDGSRRLNCIGGEAAVYLVSSSNFTDVIGTQT